MRVLIWIFKILWSGSTASLIGGALLLIAGGAAAYFMVLPYYNPAIVMTEDALADIGIPPSDMQRVIIEGKLYDGNRRAEIENERGYFGILELDNHLLLVASFEELSEGNNEYLGTMLTGASDYYEIVEDDEKLVGRRINGVFLLGEPSTSNLQAAYIIVSILLVFGIIGLIRFVIVKMQKAV